MCLEMHRGSLGSFVNEKQVKTCPKNGPRTMIFSICWRRLGILIVGDGQKVLNGLGKNKTKPKLHRGISKNEKATSKRGM